MRKRENVPISELTTMRLGGVARYVLEIEQPEDITTALEFAAQHDLPVWVMGGGANTIGRDEGFDGVIILNRLKGIFVRFDEQLIDINTLQPGQDFGDELLLTGMAGEIWDDFVRVACEMGYSGIEAMSLIPGTLGAAPVQNIGAYGQDMKQVIESVEAFDRETGSIVKLKPTEMNLGYRTTRFNSGTDKDRFIIISVTVRLRRGELQPPFYNSLQRYIDEHGVTDFSPMSIRRMVCEIREAKLPDPEKVASAGSFFKNIQLNSGEASKAEEAGIPVWRNSDGSGKINVGWLIEAAGLKGKHLHGFYISDKAALVLINEAADSYADLAAARREIVETVVKKFGFRLEQEPVELHVEGRA